MTTTSLQSRLNRFTYCGLAIVLAFAGAAAAQSDPYASLAPRGPIYQPTSPYPVEMGFSQHHSSTAFEGAQRGRAALIQAWGNYQLSTSQAAILREQAWALDRENRLKQSLALQAQKEIWGNGRRQEREQHEAQLAEGLQKIAEKRATILRQTYQLNSNEFDPTTGAINWPSVLQDAKYQDIRERVEELFRVQVGYGSPQPGNAVELARNVEELRRALRNDISNMPKNDFLAASKFLAGLRVAADTLASAA